MTDQWTQDRIDAEMEQYDDIDMDKRVLQGVLELNAERWDEVKRLRADNAAMLAALRPLASYVDILEQQFTPEELIAMDQEHHLIAHGITVADAFRARAAIARAEGRT